MVFNGELRVHGSSIAMTLSTRVTDGAKMARPALLLDGSVWPCWLPHSTHRGDDANGDTADRA